ncbi:MAG: FadR family transcriptional regulator [Deltaproteobacteria bacterium]|nr:FadR family transcriptional regulator [Deltaproteobacteria bacterium]MBW1931053.1 FadR family transcriptional regulator [Deltaproteobacteria bacterium]MBW2025122.1 FadR family transcriptional regulator [Deltaproteobacteria bacterium]MBW2125078.1 FadR family transcriptional regulator [Deltaproteobacteria bacterium]
MANRIFTPIQPKKISDEIVTQIKNLIFSGILGPGEKLPSERELAKLLNVSRVSLREALNTLQSMGLVEVQQGNRTFVRPITTRSIHDPLVAYTKSSPSNFLKVFEIRKYLEVGCAHLAATNATDLEIKQLEQSVDEMEEDFANNRLGASADLRFHTIISEATHNWAYAHLMNTIYDLLQEELRIAWGSIFKKKDRRQKLLEQHHAILEAIKSRDPEKAAKEAFVHLTFAEENFRNGLKIED